MQDTDPGNRNTHPSPSKRQTRKYFYFEFSSRMMWFLTDADILACSGSFVRFWSKYPEIHIYLSQMSCTTNNFL